MTPATHNNEEFSEIGGYTVIEKLRQGGMATLYLGTRGGAHGFSRPVAIKVMHDSVAAQPRMTQMFVDEALLGSHLHHPNVGQIEEFGEEAGRYYLIMEYIDGCSISDFRRHHRTEERSMDPMMSAYIISQAAQGLHYAHGAKDANGVPLSIVHRDVSPGNILVSRSGHVKVIDFGVAQSELRTKHTIASLKGKFRYMSPEQARGKELDPRSDVYCLGLILWELLCNRRAIQGKSDLQLLESARSPALAPVTDHADVSDELAEAVEKALAVDPEERWSSALEFSQAIRLAVPAIQHFDPSDLGAAVQTLPRGGRSHATLASSSELSKSLLSRSQSRSELRRRESVIPEVDVHDPEAEKKKRVIVGLLIAVAVVVFLWVAVPAEEPALTEESQTTSTAGQQPPPSEASEGGVNEAEEVVLPPQDEPIIAPPSPPEVTGVPERVAPAQMRARMAATPSMDEDIRVPAPEASVRLRGDSQPEQVRGILLDTGGEDNTRVRRGNREGSVRAGGTLLAE